MGWVSLGDTCVTTQELEKRVRQAASGLVSLGVKPGDTIAIYLRNDIPFIEASIAAGIVTFCTAQEWLAHPGTVDREIAGTIVRIVDQDGQELPQGELHKAPGVADCAVFGIPDEGFGEAVMAAVQPAVGVEPDESAIRDFLRQRLASYKMPRRYEFLEELPREDSGKVFKRKLRDPFWEAVTRQI